MKNDNTTELLLFKKHSSQNFSHKDLEKWMASTLLPAIREQQVMSKKIFLKKLKDTPAIYLS